MTQDNQNREAFENAAKADQSAKIVELTKQIEVMRDALEAISKTGDTCAIRALSIINN